MSTDLNVSDILSLFNVPKIEERNYWLVRTDGGNYFEDFTRNNYIAIGWDYLTLERLGYKATVKADESTIKSLISVKEDKPLHPSDSTNDPSVVTSNKSEVTKIYNKVDAFLNKLTVGDIAVIPSINSNQLLIGEISSDVYEFYKSSRDNDFSDNILANSAAPSTSIVSNDNLGKIYFSGDDDYTRCEHVKRRNVKWIKMLEKSKLDIYLRNSIKPHQAISPLNAFAGIINRSLYDVYVTDHAMHSMIRTRQTGDISLGDLKKLVDFIYDSFAILLKDDAGAEIISQNDIKIKLNIQSHGLVEVIAVGVIAPLVLSYVYAFIHNAKYGGNLKFKAEVLGAKVELEWETQGKNPKEIELLRTQLDFKQEQIDAMYEKYSEIESLDPLLPNVDFIENVSESVDDPKL